MCSSVALLFLLQVSVGGDRFSDFSGKHVSLMQVAFGGEGPKDSHHKLSKLSRHKDSTLTAVEEGEKYLTKEYSACTDLVNHGTHFTVEIEVGTPMDDTPAQKFAVVADTGSDATIVPSCTCVNAGYCSNASRCFTGANKSSSFAMTRGPHGPNGISMMFGSGPVEAVIASESVRVGNLRQFMKDGVLLMTNHQLNIRGEFEGILGLGLPGAEGKKNLYSQEAGGQKSSSKKGSAETWAQGSVREIIKALNGHGVNAQDGHGVNIQDLPSGIADALKAAAAASGAQTIVVEAPDWDSEADQVPGMFPLAGMSPLALLQNPKPDKKADALETKSTANAKDTKTHHNAVQEHKSANDSGVVVKGFLEEAGIKRFSMCFNDGKDGVLRLGTPKAQSAHGSVGEVHWGLDFRGISVGNVSTPVSFCGSKNMSENQKTPCGAIPDSGTTALMGPQDHIVMLYENLCDGWDRCQTNFTAMNLAANNAHKAAVAAYNVDPFDIKAPSKAEIFQNLIMDCKNWLTDHEGLDELPPIHFHVRGSNGSEQALQLKGWTYILETEEKEFDYVYKNIPGLGEFPAGKNFTGKMHKACSPAFAALDYDTEQNGAVWILGTPIFYEYQVGYDMETKPPSISFSSAPCGSCDGGKEGAKDDAETKKGASFMSKGDATQKVHARQPRKVNGPFRMPNIDFTQPL